MTEENLTSENNCEDEACKPKKKTVSDFFVTAITLFIMSILLIPVHYVWKGAILFCLLPICVGMIGILWVYIASKNKILIGILGIGIVAFFVRPVGVFLVLMPVIISIWGVCRAFKIKKGRVISIVAMTMILSFYILMSQTGKMRPPTMHLISKFNLLNINKAIMIYRSIKDSVQTTNDKGEVTYNGPLPTNLEILMKSGWPSECNTFKNPFSKKELKWVNGKFKGEVGYVIFLDRPEDYTGFYDEDKKFTTGHICGYEKIKFAYKGKVWVLISAGNMQEMTIEELNKQLKAENRLPAE